MHKWEGLRQRELWKKGSNLHEVVSQSAMLWWSTPVFLAKGITLRLSHDPHPRDKRACLPKISSLHSIWKELFVGIRELERELQILFFLQHLGFQRYYDLTKL